MMAEDTAGLMQALGIGKAHILGISMGGRIAQALALRHPELVNRLILVSTAARGARRPWWFRPLGLVSLLPIVRSEYPQPHYAFVRQRQASGAFNCVDRLPELRVPTLIMYGKNDRLVSDELAAELQAGIRGSTLMAFDGGHIFFAMRERQRFLEAVTRFLAS